MSTLNLTPGTGTLKTVGRQVSLPVADLQARLAAERQRLLEEEGLNVRPVAHFRRPQERPFTKKERAHTTVLFGGLTLRHEQLIHAALEGLGYKVGLIPTPIKADFQAGKEYGNNGQCNPTYFTVGALVNHLKNLRDKQGMSTQEILDNYVFITAGACGPCRFGMYEAEYRLALQNSGFDGFRVLLFQQTGGLDQAEVEAGIEFNLHFFVGLLNAIFMGDLLNEVAYHIRPYEVVPGRTDEVLSKCLALCQEQLRLRGAKQPEGGWLAALLSKVAPVSGRDDAQEFIEQLWGDHFMNVFRSCAKMLREEVEVDYTRPKPMVKITGEFWAQTTEGDGNFRMFPFLEREGAEVLVEPIGTWIAYMLAQAKQENQDTRGLKDGAERPGRFNVRERFRLERDYLRKQVMFTLADKIINREYERLRNALGGTAHALVNQLELQRMGHPYYNSRSGGGEGHLEVAKAIYYSNKDLCHMVLSLKPFGCMPSTQSDGAQAAVVAHFPQLIFLPIETSGEGDINAHSRVQMALGEAKVKCKAEFKAALEQCGYPIEQIRAYVAEHRELRDPLQHVPHHAGVIGRAANFILHVAERMRAEQIQPTQGVHLKNEAVLVTN